MDIFRWERKRLYRLRKRIFSDVLVKLIRWVALPCQIQISEKYCIRASSINTRLPRILKPIVQELCTAATPRGPSRTLTPQLAFRVIKSRIYSISVLGVSLGPYDESLNARERTVRGSKDRKRKKRQREKGWRWKKGQGRGRKMHLYMWEIESRTVIAAT